MKMSASKAEIIALAKGIGTNLSVSEDILLAFIEIESAYNTYAARYEPEWTYFTKIEGYAAISMVTALTERMLQATSLGVMQVMGSVARELGFKDNLLHLTQPELGIYYGALKLRALMKKYSDLSDVISAYNQGVPLKENGKYKNQTYVDMVRGALLGKAWNAK